MGIERMIGRKAARKEEILRQQKAKEEAMHGREMARTKLWPILVKYAKDAKHAEDTLNILKAAITTIMQIPYRTMTIEGLKVAEELTKDTTAPDQEFHAELIEVLKLETIPQAAKLLEGMAGSINGYTSKMAGQKPMSEIELNEIVN